MWIAKSAWKLLETQSYSQRTALERLSMKLEQLEAHHQAEEDQRTQDLRELERLTGLLKRAENRAAALEIQLQEIQRMRPPAALPRWAQDVDWSRVEGGPEAQ